ncbi:hypothetical protein CC79DRAFT_1338427 [Sarocladium strictum]
MSRIDAMRARWKQIRADAVGGRDVVSWALQNPEDFKDNPVLRSALFNRHPFTVKDQNDMIQSLTDGLGHNHEHVVERAAHPDRIDLLENLEVLKLAYCDSTIVADKQDLTRMYEARLRDEELQTREEQARESVRTEAEKTARRNAKLLIPEIEKLTAQDIENMGLTSPERRKNLLAIWRRVAHPPPQWIRTIADNAKPWGFVYYKTAELEQEFGHDWKKTWDEIMTLECDLPEDLYEPGALKRMTSESIHYGGFWMDHLHFFEEIWPTPGVVKDIDDDEGSRAQFREYRKTIPSDSPGILGNTFIVLEKEPVVKKLGVNRLPLAVWAHDPDWYPPTGAEAATSKVRAEQMRLGYRGRVKVLRLALDSWFYAARAENIDMYDMWLKAEREPDKIWYCRTKYIEQWDHEPFV